MFQFITKSISPSRTGHTKWEQKKIHSLFCRDGKRKLPRRLARSLHVVSRPRSLARLLTELIHALLSLSQGSTAKAGLDHSKLPLSTCHLSLSRLFVSQDQSHASETLVSPLVQRLSATVALCAGKKKQNANYHPPHPITGISAESKKFPNAGCPMSNL